MEELWTRIILVIAVFFAIMILNAYHKHFFVVYFNFAHGIITEIIVSLFCGMIITIFACAFWPIVLLAIGLFAFWNVRKTTDEYKKQQLVVMAVIFCVLVSVLGIGSWILWI